jgi:hypothetical protein
MGDFRGDSVHLGCGVFEPYFIKPVLHLNGQNIPGFQSVYLKVRDDIVLALGLLLWCCFGVSAAGR